jgi:hypothetical protein
MYTPSTTALHTYIHGSVTVGQKDTCYYYLAVEADPSPVEVGTVD